MAAAHCCHPWTSRTCPLCIDLYSHSSGAGTNHCLCRALARLCVTAVRGCRSGWVGAQTEEEGAKLGERNTSAMVDTGTQQHQAASKGSRAERTGARVPVAGRPPPQTRPSLTDLTLHPPPPPPRAERRWCCCRRAAWRRAHTGRSLCGWWRRLSCRGRGRAWA